MLLPSALGFSPHPPVSVYGTGTWQTIAAFLGSHYTDFATIFRSASDERVTCADLPSHRLPSLPGVFHPPVPPHACVPTVLLPCGTGISTCCPSDTLLSLSLGPDFPRADQLYSGNLGYSAGRIPTFLSLLIPAFSLLIPPPLLIGMASQVLRMLLYQSLRFLSFGVVFQPRTFSAQELSTSELLRTL